MAQALRELIQSAIDPLVRAAQELSDEAACMDVQIDQEWGTGKYQTHPKITALRTALAQFERKP